MVGRIACDQDPEEVKVSGMACLSISGEHILMLAFSSVSLSSLSWDRRQNIAELAMYS
jgi:hypothetical protein